MLLAPRSPGGEALRCPCERSGDRRWPFVRARSLGKGEQWPQQNRRAAKALRFRQQHPDGPALRVGEGACTGEFGGESSGAASLLRVENENPALNPIRPSMRSAREGALRRPTAPLPVASGGVRSTASQSRSGTRSTRDPWAPQHERRRPAPLGLPFRTAPGTRPWRWPGAAQSRRVRPLQSRGAS